MICYRLCRSILIILLLLILIACQLRPKNKDDVPTIIPNENEVSHSTLSSTEARATPSATREKPLSTLPASATPPRTTPSVTKESTVSSSRDETISIDRKEDLIDWLLDVGMEREPTEVQQLLLDAGWIAKAEDWQVLDLDGDAQVEGILTLIEEPEFYYDVPWTSVFIMDDELTIFEKYSERQGIYRVLAIEDFSGDELPDVVIESTTRGGNYFPLTYHLLSTHHGSLQSVVQPPPNVRETYSFHEGEFISIAVESWEAVQFLDFTQDGLPDLIFKGIAGGGAGGGVSRPFEAVWAWNGEAVALADVEWQKTDYRFHNLYNANEAFEKGEDETAYLLYHHVLSDELLSDDVSSFCTYHQESDTCQREPWTAPQELYESNRQVAAFRLALLALVRAEYEGNSKTWRREAQYWQDWLHESYPDAPLAVASDILLAEWDATEDLTQSCQALQVALNEKYSLDKEVVGPLIDMGYNNPPLTVDQLCIVPEQIEQTTTQKSLLVSELEEIVLPTLLSAPPEAGYIPGKEKLNVIPLQVDRPQAPLWAVFTTGSVGDYPTITHFLAIYTLNGNGWQEIASITFGEPNYVENSSVRQIRVSDDYIWLELFGGVGGNSSQYKVLRFDGEQLHVEIDHFRTRHGGFDLSPIDLDNNGMLDFILSPIENYVFCLRECDVRYYKFLVLRWNGEVFAEVPLTTLHPSTPAELRELNDRAVELANAGLWKDALSTIREARAIDYNSPRNPYVAWNEFIINLHAEAMFKHTWEDGPNNYPLLATILYGDYDRTLDIMRDYPVEKLFSSECPLIIGTLAQGWQKELNEWIQKTTELALTAQPELATAYFLRAWSSHLVNPSNTQILLDLERAVELVPDEVLFTQSLEYLQIE